MASTRPEISSRAFHDIDESLGSLRRILAMLPAAGPLNGEQAACLSVATQTTTRMRSLFREEGSRQGIKYPPE